MVWNVEYPPDATPTWEVSTPVEQMQRMVSDAGKIGFLKGALIGLKFRVDDETRKVIDDVLRQVEE